MGTSGNIGLWAGLVPRLADRYRVIAFDNRGLGGSERGTGPISVASMAEDTAALLEALDVPKAHIVGWSLGSAVAQELALAHPERLASAVMYATWGRCNGFQRSVLTALRLPYAVRDMDSALAAAGLAFSPQLLDHPDLPQMIETMLPAFPQNEEQMQVTVEQWDADLVHDTLDRLGGDHRADAGGGRRAGPADAARPGQGGRRRHPRGPLRAGDRAGVEPRPAHRAARRPASASSPTSCTTTSWSAGQPRWARRRRGPCWREGLFHRPPPPPRGRLKADQPAGRVGAPEEIRALCSGSPLGHRGESPQRWARGSASRC